MLNQLAAEEWSKIFIFLLLMIQTFIKETGYFFNPLVPRHSYSYSEIGLSCLTSCLFVWIIFTSLLSTCRPYRDRSLLTGHDALLLGQIARDLLHASSHRHDNTWTALCWARTWMARLMDRDANHCAISPPRLDVQCIALVSRLHVKFINICIPFIKRIKYTLSRAWLFTF